MVPRKDFTRVLSQYWADGPSSETPPGHWFKLFNDVSSNPLLQKRWMGQGEILDDMDWYVRGYFTVGAGVHDAAIACWGAKGYYDYTRPIMAIRWMGSRGQCTDSTLSNYHPAGLPLIPGYIEVVGENDPLALADPTAINKIKVFSWRGPVAATGEDGAGWLLAERWWTYQAATFVTPPFAGYYSGHSTYSRTAAEIMTLITGDEYFPGGMAEYDATPGYLIADSGPSVEVKLQWATYRDASDQCSLSRIYGGLHPPQDDIPGRVTGLIVGPQVVDKANEFILANLAGCIDSLACNFNPLADSADASCVYPGCNQPTACNYNPLAGCDDGTCDLSAGCTDSLACNYDANAACDNGSCSLPDGCTDITACNYDSLATCNDGSCFLPDGCTDINACNYDSLATCDNGTCILPDGCTDINACNYDSLAACDNGTCILPDGCTDINACNYDSLAACDNGTCILPDGCTDINACNYDSLAACDNGTCILPDGCTDINACNYDSLAACDNGTCILPDGCTDTNACNYDSLASCDNGLCSYPGCIDSLALNFNPLAGCDDGSCNYAPTCDSLSIIFDQSPCVYLPGSNVLSAVIKITLTHTGDCDVASIDGISDFPTDTLDSYHYTLYVPDEETLTLQFSLTNGSTSENFEYSAAPCDEDPTLCDCNGNSFGLGVLGWLGDGFADTSIGVWQGQLVNFNCALWGYDCGDIAGAPNDDPNGVCNGGLPPSADSTGATAFGCPVEIIELMAYSKLLIYPNPTNGQLNVSINAPYENRWIRVFDQTGKWVHNEQRFMGGGSTETLDLDYLPAGSYHIQVASNDEILNSVIMIQH
jgi:hypothetical protein